MQFSTLALIAAAISTTFAATSDPDWVTYTKDLGTATIVVTRYKGSTALEGSEYTTQTVVVSENGTAKYTEVLTKKKDDAAATSSAAAAEEVAESTTAEAAAAATSEAESSVAEVSTYTGGAINVGASVGALALGAAVLLI